MSNNAQNATEAAYGVLSNESTTQQLYGHLGDYIYSTILHPELAPEYADTISRIIMECSWRSYEADGGVRDYTDAQLEHDVKAKYGVPLLKAVHAHCMEQAFAA